MKRICGIGLVVTVLLSACSSPPRNEPPGSVGMPTVPVAKAPVNPPPGLPSSYACRYTPLAQASGGFYKDDGPLALPADIDAVLEPLPRAEPLHRWANNPYNVLGQSFTPLKTVGELKQQGMASWYGRKFHGQKTSSGEAYDMFQMTAAHPFLPIPSYARVTNLNNGRSVVVRINDRGPFLKGRVIDLSFLAACRLDYAMAGSTQVEVVSLLPGTASVALNSAPAVESPVLRAIPMRPAAEDVSAMMQRQPEAVLAQTGSSVFLQLGAFGSRSNAESFHAHLTRELDEPQAGLLVIQQAGGIYRVRLGPYPDRPAAVAVAERLTGQTNLPVLVVR